MEAEDRGLRNPQVIEHVHQAVRQHPQSRVGGQGIGVAKTQRVRRDHVITRGQVGNQTQIGS